MAEPPLELHVPDLLVDFTTMSVTGEETLALTETVQLDSAEPQTASKLELALPNPQSVTLPESVTTATSEVEFTFLPPQLAAGLAELRAELRRVEGYMARMELELAGDTTEDEAASQEKAAPGTALLDTAVLNISNGLASASQDGAASEEHAALGDASLDSAVLNIADPQEQPVLGTALLDSAVLNVPEQEDAHASANLDIAAAKNTSTTGIAALGDVILDNTAAALTFDIVAFLKAFPHLAPTLTSITTGTTTITITTGTTYTFSPLRAENSA